VLALLLLPFAAQAQSQPEIDYMLHCRGCHGPDGAAHPKVPALREVLGPLLRTADGREYIVRVPGVARAALDDERLAALLNWLVVRFASERPARPYAAAEVAALRASPLVDPVAQRARLPEQTR
jgi:hypothetical protein